MDSTIPQGALHDSGWDTILPELGPCRLMDLYSILSWGEPLQCTTSPRQQVHKCYPKYLCDLMEKNDNRSHTVKQSLGFTDAMVHDVYINHMHDKNVIKSLKRI